MNVRCCIVTSTEYDCIIMVIPVMEDVIDFNGHVVAFLVKLQLTETTLEL